jgi:hypothetical protein
MNWFKRKKKCCTKELEERLWKLENPCVVKPKSVVVFHDGSDDGVRVFVLSCEVVLRSEGWAIYAPPTKYYDYKIQVLGEYGIEYTLYQSEDRLTKCKDKTFTIKLDK